MDLPPIVVLDVAAQVPASLSRLAVRGCSVTLGNRCVAREEVVDAPDDSLQRGWLAVLSGSGDATTLIRVELRPIDRPVSIVALRELAFQDSDTPNQRWATAGVVVAALVMQAESGELTSPPVAERPAETSPPVSPKPPILPTAPVKSELSTPPQASPGLFLEAVALTGPSLEGQGYRFGGELSLLVPLGSEHFFGWVGIGASREGGILRTTTLGPTLGVLAQLAVVPQHLLLEAGIGGIATGMMISSEYQGETASAIRLVAGAEGRLGLVLQLRPAVALSLGGRAAAQRPRLVVEQAGRTAAQQARIESTIHLGVRVTL